MTDKVHGNAVGFSDTNTTAHILQKQVAFYLKNIYDNSINSIYGIRPKYHKVIQPVFPLQ